MLFGRKLKQDQQKLLDRVVKAELDPNQVLPHSDDISIIDGVGYRVDGPWIAEEVDLIQKRCERRNVLLMQSVLEDRLATPKHPRDGTTALVLAHFLNRGLPKRFYISRNRMATKLMPGKHDQTRLAQNRPRRVEVDWCGPTTRISHAAAFGAQVAD